MRKWALWATLATLLQVTIVCDSSEFEDFFDDIGLEVYYDGHDHHRHHDDCWFDCDDEWFFDLDWW